MPKKSYYIIILALLIAGNTIGQLKPHKEAQKAVAPLEDAKKWFAAWELVSKTIFHIDSLQPVEFVFFDDHYVYTTSNVSVPQGELITGPPLLGKKLTWKRAAHNGKITMPDHKTVPIGLMSFAAPLEEPGRNAFFVMPLPAFWKSAGVVSKEFGLDNLVTGVFLHEFSHTQQMRNFGKKISEYEQNNVFKTDFSDDIVQDYFKTDSIYNVAFRKEVALLYEAAATLNPTQQKSLIRQGLDMMESRHKKYFIGEEEKFRQIDQFFLTMEGLGQYAMYAWLIHPQGGNIDQATALAGVRRGGRQWSQEEGLSLFLILDKFSAPGSWSGLMFGTTTTSVIELIEKAIK